MAHDRSAAIGRVPRGIYVEIPIDACNRASFDDADAVKEGPCHVEPISSRS
jgi:hypothetical protein